MHAVVAAPRVAREELGEAALDDARAPDHYRARLGGDEFDVPPGQLAVERATRACEHRVVGGLERAAREQEPSAPGVDQGDMGLEREVRKEGTDAHALGFRLCEHARDLLRGTRQQAGYGLVYGIQTL